MEEKLTDKALSNMPIKAIYNRIKSYMSEEEVTEYKSITDETKRRAYIVDLYKKYVNSETEAAVNTIGETTPAEEIESFENIDEKTEPTVMKDEVTPSAPTAQQDLLKDEEGLIIKPLTDSIAEKIDASSTFYTVSIRGVPNHNGMCTINTEQLLLLCFRYPKAVVEFKTKQRATQFIALVKSIPTIKGIYAITSVMREDVVKNITNVNKLK